MSSSLFSQNFSDHLFHSTILSSSLSMPAASLSSIHFNPLSSPLHNSHSHKPKLLLISMANPQSYWASVTTEIDTHLKQTIPMKPPLRVFEPMHHLTFAAPQTSAPALCIAACELLGGRREHALAAAAALRLMQSAAFTHQNMPLTDDPRPIPGHRYGPNLELLTADGMVPFGFELLARAQNDPGRILRVIIEISNTMGSKGIIEGQFNELTHNKSKRGDGLVQGTWLNDVCRKKEGRIHACAGACGAILGGGNEEETQKMRRYGVYVGMIQGILKKVEGKGNEELYLKEVNELRELGLNELKDFNQEKIGAISSLLHTKFSDA